MALPSSAPERPIDRALSLAAAGDALGALRFALPMLEAEPKNALSLFVAGYALRAIGHTDAGRRAFHAAGTRAIDASALPLAVASAAELRADGDDPNPLFEAIAQAFGRGSQRLRERRAAPPELPHAEPDLLPVDETLDEEALVLRASTLLDAVEQGLADDRAELGKLPLAPQPLFSSLTPDSLQEMISIFEVQILASGAKLVEEGSIGAEAFIVARGELEVEKRAPHDASRSIRLARLGSGALVGEMALLSRAPRAATVTTLRPSIILVGHKDALDGVVTRAPQLGQQFAEHCKRRMIDNLVRTSALFGAASPAERPGLVERFGIRTFEAGEPLARQGQPSEGLHLIASGQVSILHQEGDASEDRTLVAKLGSGDVVGEVALLLRRPAIADAIAQHPTVTLFLPRERVRELVRNHPKVFAELYDLAVTRDEETATMALEEATEGDDFILV